MYKPKHFALHEYLPPRLYKELDAQGRLESGWELLDDRLLRLDDQLREKFGPITINNWWWGGPREWSGLRTADSPYYSETSQHTFGRASDKQFQKVTEVYVRKYILDNPDEFSLLMSMEIIDPAQVEEDWTHSDVRNCHRIKTYKP